MQLDLQGHPHRRYDPLGGRWVLVSASRTDRPWQGAREAEAATGMLPRHDPDCYLCPGNVRARGYRNPEYATTFVFRNDFSALRPDTPALTVEPHPLLRAQTQAGECRVLCYSPRHDLHLAHMDRGAVRQVVDLWIEQLEELSGSYTWVQIFENRGAAMGASNPHPHGQLWAGTAMPEGPRREDRHQRERFDHAGKPLLVEYGELEAEEGVRLVASNDHWLAVVPFWAVWPFETLVLPRRHCPRLTDLDSAERDTLAALLGELLGAYDALFGISFPYSMGWHGAPGRGEEASHWQVHAHFHPPLLRSASVRKFMVGYELLADAQRDLTAEDAAQRLRAALATVPTGRDDD